MNKLKLLHSARLTALGLAVIFAGTGCRGPSTMRMVFSDYSQAYADTSNQQMLMNLARRANGHSAYYLQLGGITTTFSFGANASGGASEGRTKASGGALAAAAALSTTVTQSGSLTLSAGEQPTFSFVPLSGTSFGNALFEPINPRIFFSLFEQGARGDQLLRTMVQSVTITEGGFARTFFNVPDVEQPQNYRNFLTVAALVRELQKKHLLQSSTDFKSFVLLPGSAEEIKRLQKEDNAYNYSEDRSTVQKATTQESTVSLSLRTFDGVLNALATEANVYDEWIRKSGLKFLDEVPKSQRHPVLRIQPRADSKKLSKPAAVVNYQGESYSIVDELQGDPLLQNWNREVFNRLNLLFVAVSMDPNKLPVQQMIQIR